MISLIFREKIKFERKKCSPLDEFLLERYQTRSQSRTIPPFPPQFLSLQRHCTATFEIYELQSAEQAHF